MHDEARSSVRGLLWGAMSQTLHPPPEDGADAPRVTRHYLDVQYGKKEAKTRVWVYTKNDTDAQLWRFDDKGRLERYVVRGSAVVHHA